MIHIWYKPLWCLFRFVWAGGVADGITADGTDAMVGMAILTKPTIFGTVATLGIMEEVLDLTPTLGVHPTTHAALFIPILRAYLRAQLEYKW